MAAKSINWQIIRFENIKYKTKEPGFKNILNF